MQDFKLKILLSLKGMRVVIPNIQAQKDDDIEQLEGKTGPSDEQAMMRTVMESDKTDIDDGKLVNDLLNQGMQSFQPDVMFQNMVQNFQQAKQLYGETLLAQATGSDCNTLERNIKLPEFQRDIKSKLTSKAKEMQKKGLLSRRGEIEDDGFILASAQLFIDEIDTLTPKGLLGEREHKQLSHYGGFDTTHPYRKGDRYKDIAIKQTLKKTIRRGLKTIQPETLVTFDRVSKGNITIVYAIDASGSMRGRRIRVAKKAGVALAYKATQKNDKVGVVVFAHEVKQEIRPTTNFLEILFSLTKITAAKQTDIAKTIEHSTELFSNSTTDTNHLILLTDAAATVGDNPQKRVLDAIATACSGNITISIIGIDLDEDTLPFAQKMAELGRGKLYVVTNLDDLDKIVLHDYESFL